MSVMPVARVMATIRLSPILVSHAPSVRTKMIINRLCVVRLVINARVSMAPSRARRASSRCERFATKAIMVRAMSIPGKLKICIPPGDRKPQLLG